MTPGEIEGCQKHEDESFPHRPGNCDAWSRTIVNPVSLVDSDLFSILAYVYGLAVDEKRNLDLSYVESLVSASSRSIDVVSYVVAVLFKLDK